MLISSKHFIQLVCLQCDNSVTQIICVAIRVKDQRNYERTNLAAVSRRARKRNLVCILAVLYLCYQASRRQGLNAYLVHRHAGVRPKKMGVFRGLKTTSLNKLGWWGCRSRATEQRVPGRCLHEFSVSQRFA